MLPHDFAERINWPAHRRTSGVSTFIVGTLPDVRLVAPMQSTFRLRLDRRTILFRLLTKAAV
jgi:hypothetical protein